MPAMPAFWSTAPRPKTLPSSTLPVNGIAVPLRQVADIRRCRGARRRRTRAARCRCGPARCPAGRSAPRRSRPLPSRAPPGARTASSCPDRPRAATMSRRKAIIGDWSSCARAAMRRPCSSLSSSWSCPSLRSGLPAHGPPQPGRRLLQSRGFHRRPHAGRDRRARRPRRRRRCPRGGSRTAGGSARCRWSGASSGSCRRMMKSAGAPGSRLPNGSPKVSRARR